MKPVDLKKIEKELKQYGSLGIGYPIIEIITDLITEIKYLRKKKKELNKISEQLVDLALDLYKRIDNETDISKKGKK